MGNFWHLNSFKMPTKNLQKPAKCQSVLKHLRHSSSGMNSVKKRGIWQNVLRTLFYHKCFVSKSFLHSFSLTRNLSEYLMAAETVSVFTERMRLHGELKVFPPNETNVICTTIPIIFVWFNWNKVVDLYFTNNSH